jgi:hypothetical protein
MGRSLVGGPARLFWSAPAGPSRQDGRVAGESSYVERVPTPALAAVASSVWIQQVGERPLAQRHMPHGGAEVRCVLGAPPRLLGPLTASKYQEIPAGATVVGVRLRPGVLGGLARMPADELVDQDVAASDLWGDVGRLTDLLGLPRRRGSRSTGSSRSSRDR